MLGRPATPRHRVSTGGLSAKASVFPPLPNPSPARGEGLKSVRFGCGSWVGADAGPGARRRRAGPRAQRRGSQAVASTSTRISAVGSMPVTSTTVEAGGWPGKNSLRTRL